MWLKKVAELIMDDENGLEGISEHKWRDIGHSEISDLRPVLPWMEEYYDQEGQEIPHQTPYHQESIIEHIRRVVQEVKAIGMFKNKPLLADLLAISAVFHDHWKIRTRAPKIKFQCSICGNQTGKNTTPCRNCGANEQMQQVETMGYHEHETLGAKEENLFPRLQQFNIPHRYFEIIQLLIRNHLKMHEIIGQISSGSVNEEKMSRSLNKIFGNLPPNFNLLDVIQMAVALSLADDKGRDTDKPTDVANRGELSPQEIVLNLSQMIMEIMNKNFSSQQRKTELLSDDLSKVAIFLANNGIAIDLPDISTKNELFSALASSGNKDIIQEIINMLNKEHS